MFPTFPNTSRSLLKLAAVLGVLGLGVSDASAVSFKVKLACASDYYSYCSKHAPDTPGVRQCMRANGPKLSKTCINALIDAGEVSQAEVARRAAALR
jgi:hypothetical protein